MLARQIGFVLLGLGTMKGSQTYVWISDSITVSYRPPCFTLITAIDCLPIPLTCLIYLYYEPNWFIVNFIMFCISCLALIIGLILPESPNWLLLTNQREKAIETLNYIAKLNGISYRIPKD